MPIAPADTLLNKYCIVRLLGQGASANVWLADEITFGNRMVVMFHSFTKCWSHPRFDLRSCGYGALGV